MATDSIDTNIVLRCILGDVLEYNYMMVSTALPYYLAHPKLSWADCALSVEAELKHREPLFIFDKKLANQLPQAKLLA